MTNKAYIMRELRGEILSFLYYIYPSDISDISILETFHAEHKVPEIEKALAYLEDKDYVEKLIHKAPGRMFDDIGKYKITARGIDLAEGNSEDNGVLVSMGK